MNTPEGVYVRRVRLAGMTQRTDAGRLSVRVPSELCFIEHVIDLVARHCLELGMSAQAARFNVRVALAEALSNAMQYGNGMDARKLVDVTADVLENRIQISVQDQGRGFNPRDVPDPTHATNLEHPGGRGLFLIRRLVDEVSFNDRGNAICMTWNSA